MSRLCWRSFWFGLGLPLAWCLSHGFFWLGHFWSRWIINRIPDGWEAVGDIVAEPYQVFMRWSCDLSDYYGLGIWK